MNGVIVIDKPKGITSQAVVNRVKHACGVKKAGHGGTLDPLATGVLPVMVGNAVAASDYIMCGDKRYLAGIDFGYETDSEDITGTVTKRYDSPAPSFDALCKACESFVGDIEQTPPMYSALKVGGRKLVDLARRGIEIQREPRRITVFGITPSQTESGFFIEVHCSKGTYIRTLCADIGRFLGCGAVMSSLRRLSAGRFSISEAIPLDEFCAMSDAQKESLLVPPEALFGNFAAIELDESEEFRFRNGCMIPVGISGSEGEILRVFTESGFIALGTLLLSDGALCLKVKKFFL